MRPMDAPRTDDQPQPAPSLRGALLLLLVGVILNVLLLGRGAQLPSSLLIAVNAALNVVMLTGAVWLGGLLAYRSIMRSRE
jgi:hypothetical protein